MKKSFCVILLVAFLDVNATKIDSLFSQANELFTIEQIDSSIVLYDSIISLGYQSEELYFNLGNCFYLKGDIPKSILYFEKSLKQNPSNNFAIENLQLCYKRIVYLEQLPSLFTHRWWNKITDLLSIKAWSVTLLLFVWLLCISVFTFYFKRKRSFFKLLMVLILCTIFTLAAFQSKKADDNKRYGILQENTALHKQSNTNNKISDVGKGNKALILSQKKQWSNVRFSNGLQGWIKTQNLSDI